MEINFCKYLTIVKKHTLDNKVVDMSGRRVEDSHDRLMSIIKEVVLLVVGISFIMNPFMSIMAQYGVLISSIDYSMISVGLYCILLNKGK